MPGLSVRALPAAGGPGAGGIGPIPGPPVTIPSGVSGITQVTIAFARTCFLKRYGTVTCWGELLQCLL